MKGLAFSPVKGYKAVMRIDEQIKPGVPTVSFEFFPPKTDEGFNKLYGTINQLRELQPSYVSVTYGAGGSTRSKTVELTEKVQNEIGLTAMAHLTCVGHTKDEIGEILDELWNAGVKNVLALRGDAPTGGRWAQHEGGFANSTELTRYVKNRHDFFVAVGGYPEGHPECLNKTRDLEHLKQKVDAGADVIVTQLFFDNAYFYDWRDKCRTMGIEVPIIAGMMPIQNVGQIKRFVGMCGAKIPHPLLTKLEGLDGDTAAVEAAGVDYARRQCQDLLFHGVDGLHFYTLNKHPATLQIVRDLGLPHVQQAAAVA
ncbi:MAG: methylenetetrahydrofolate reductase [NAD(P)H] [Phycisphaerae bacterium]